jgi:hypothetical protein
VKGFQIRRNELHILSHKVDLFVQTFEKELEQYLHVWLQDKKHTSHTYYVIEDFDNKTANV